MACAKQEVIAQIEGDSVYSKLKWEAGVHRVQRVPATESAGRIHTSTATVCIMPEVEDVDVELNMNDIDIKFARASGAGGQNVRSCGAVGVYVCVRAGLDRASLSGLHTAAAPAGTVYGHGRRWSRACACIRRLCIQSNNGQMEEGVPRSAFPPPILSHASNRTTYSGTP